MNGTMPALFAEYSTTDSHFAQVDLSGRRTTFRNPMGQQQQVAYNPVLTDSEAEAYTIDRVFPGWHPDQRAAQVRPPLLKAKGKVITWDDIPEAGCYAVCRDRKIIAFTTKPTYTITSAPEGACFSVRCANWYGGLGPRSPEVVYPFK